MKQRLMAVLAHPDDESLGCGGTLAHYASRGVETWVVTATRGQRGRYHGERFGEGSLHPGPEGLGRIREAELEAAVRTLGVTGLTVLDYMDGALAGAPVGTAVARIAAEIRERRPQVVITFAPDGAYGHPDHVAISQLTTAAVLRAASSGPRGEPAHTVTKLYYMAWTRGVWDAYQEAFKRLTMTVDGVVRQASPWPDWAITTRVDTGAHWMRVWRAVSCHQSQVAAYERLQQLTPANHRALWGAQEFYRAFTLVDTAPGLERDLFQGITRSAENAA